TKTRAAAAVSTRMTVTVLAADDGSPAAGARVVAFTNFESRAGVEGTTNAQGVVKLSPGAAKLERLYVYPAKDFWGRLLKNVKVKAELAVKLDPVKLDAADALRHYYQPAPDGTGAGVTVGIVDTGVGPHPDLLVAGGANTVQGENADNFTDNGEGHGTHVAGIVAARGTPPAGVRGLAPGVNLRSYRVFG